MARSGFDKASSVDDLAKFAEGCHCSSIRNATSTNSRIVVATIESAHGNGRL